MGELAVLPAQAYVYVIGPADGPQKIGRATDPQSRLQALQCGNSIDLKLSLALPISRDEASELEIYLHWKMAPRHVRGEWFNISPDEAIAIANEGFAEFQDGARAPGRALPPAITINITPAQIRAARALLDWKQSDLAAASGVSEISIKNIERSKTDAKASTLAAIQDAFRSAGVVFLEPGDMRQGGGGVRFEH